MLYKCFVFTGNAINPANTIHSPNARLMLGRRLRRRPNINLALGQCIVFTGNRGLGGCTAAMLVLLSAAFDTV